MLKQMPDLGSTVAIDASEMPAFANGQRFVYKGGPERKTGLPPGDPAARHASGQGRQAPPAYLRAR